MIMCKSLRRGAGVGLRHVVKPSEYTPLTTLKLAKIFTEAACRPRVQRRQWPRPERRQDAGRAWRHQQAVLTGGTEAGRIAGAAAAKVFAHQTMNSAAKLR